MKRTILLVEDDALVSETIGRFLERRGRAVLRAGSAVEAADLLRANRVDAVLLDNHLPGRMGLTALPSLRTLTGAPFIVMTGHPDDQTAEDAKLIGAATMVGKPLDLDALDGLLESLIK